MKPKITGIPIAQKKKVHLQRTPAPTIVVATMKALVYEGAGKIELKDVPIPVITKSTDLLSKY